MGNHSPLSFQCSALERILDALRPVRANGDAVPTQSVGTRETTEAVIAERNR
jgi:hypothetical protein